MNAQIVVVHADGSSELVDLDIGEHVLGRGPEAHVPLRSDFASNRHAALSWNGTTLSVADLGSRNGTTVNGRRIDRQWVPLSTGDRLTFGLTEAQVFSALEPKPITSLAPESVGPKPAAAQPVAVSGNMVSASGGAIAAGRDVIYTQTVRESEVGFLAGVFATPSTGRKMMGWGLALVVAGFGLSMGIFAWGAANSAREFERGFNNGSPSIDTSDEVVTFTVFLIGMGISSIGSILMLVGFFVALARHHRRKEEARVRRATMEAQWRS